MRYLCYFQTNTVNKRAKINSAVHEYTKVVFTIFYILYIKTFCNNKYSSSKLVMAAVFMGLSFAFIYNFRIHIANTP
jgi:hypothetical protein